MSSLPEEESMTTAIWKAPDCDKLLCTPGFSTKVDAWAAPIENIGANRKSARLLIKVLLFITGLLAKYLSGKISHKFIPVYVGFFPTSRTFWCILELRIRGFRINPYFNWG
jgi:hypothetical protein